MKLSRGRLAALASIAALAGTSAVAQTPPAGGKLALYAALPGDQHLSLSPDGSKLAYVVMVGDKGIITVVDVKTSKQAATLGLGEQRVRELKWADNDNLVLVYNSAGQTGMTDLSSNVAGALTLSLMQVQPVSASELTISTGKQKPLLEKVSSALIFSGPEIRVEKDKSIVLVGAMAGAVVGDLQQNRTRGSATTTQSTAAYLPVEFAAVPGKPAPDVRGETDGLAHQFIFKPDGQLDATVEIQSFNHSTIDLNGGGQIDMPSTVQHGPAFLGYAADGVSFIVATEENSDTIISQVTHTPKAVWTKLPLNKGDDILFDRLTNRYWGAGHWEGDKKVYTFVKPEDTAAWANIQGALPKVALTIESVSDDHKHLIVEANSPTDGPTDYLIDLASSQVDQISKAYPGLTPADISPVKEIGYKAADGLEITGYLTVPAKAGANPRGLPLVVLPHDGPLQRDYGDFNWLAQALASQGYAVLQPNFRGSTGLGHDFEQAGLGEWGKKMESDLSDGVRAMAELGVIDPKRVCIMGVNYGGYAALMGVSATQGGYRCAIAVGAPTDLTRYLNRVNLDTPMVTGPYEPRLPNELNLRYWSQLMGGLTSTLDPRMTLLSPAANAANATAPILLIHAQNDDVVPYEQATVMQAALTKAGKPVQLVTLKSKDHNLDRADSRKQTLDAVTAFLAKNNPAN